MKQGPFASGGAVPSLAVVCHYDPLRLPLDRLPLPGMTGYRQASLPATHRGGAEEDLPISEDNLSDRSTPTTPGGSSVPASGSLAPSLAFAVRTSARLPLGPPLSGLELTTLIRPRNFALATDRSVVSPRFAPGLSTTHGGVPTGDPDVSPDQTFPGWLPQFARSRHVIWMSSFMHGVPELMGTRSSSSSPSPWRWPSARACTAPCGPSVPCPARSAAWW